MSIKEAILKNYGSIPDLETGQVSDQELFGRCFQWTRDPESYPTKWAIVRHIEEHGLPSQHVSTNSLNINGKVTQDSFEKYLSSNEYYSSGQIAKAILGTELDLFYEREEGWKEELEKHRNSKSFALGTFIHQCILEPSKWDRIAIQPYHSRASHAGCDALIKWWEELIFETYSEDKGKAPSIISHALSGVEENDPSSLIYKKQYIDALQRESSIEIVKESDYVKISILRSRWRMYENRIWQTLMKHSKREISFYVEDLHGLPQRCRADAILFEENIGVNAILSIKSTSQPNLRLFLSQCAKLGYHVKEAAYQEIISHVTGRDFATTIMVMFSNSCTLWNSCYYA